MYKLHRKNVKVYFVAAFFSCPCKKNGHEHDTTSFCTVQYSVYSLNENNFLSTFTIKLLKSGVTGEIDTTSYSSRTLCQQRRQQFGLVGQKMAAGWLGQKMTAGWVGQKMAAGCIVQKMTTGWVGQIMAADSVHLVPIIIAQ